MEHPQTRPYGSGGRKATHDFLSLHSHSTVQQDPSPPSQAGAYLKTHDFLQPLECMSRTASAKEESRTEAAAIEKPPPPAPPPSGEHILPGGIGTYTISHMSYFNHKVPKPEGTTFTVDQSSKTDRNDENSNCSSYSGSGFTLWQESCVKKGKTGKENFGERPVARVDKLGQWTTERPSQSSSNNHCNSFSSLSSPQHLGKKTQSFMDMIKSAKVITQDEDDMDDEDEFSLKKEASSTYKGDLRVRVDAKSSDHNANTPRSKHSATEQRRRSKINDRFQMLRELIPHSDQKRDKASFLLEVIEYIQYLQEKANKYDESFQGWNHEPAKPMPWRNNQRHAESFIDQSRGLCNGSGPALVFAAKLDEKNITVSPNILGNAQNTAAAFKSINHHPGLANKAAPFPISAQPNIFAPARNGGALVQFPPRLPSDSANSTSQPHNQLYQTRLCSTEGAVPSEKMKEQDLKIEGGTINISSAHSQGLLNTLTQALQSSGVDLSQASISVQIEVGKRATAPTSTVKDNQGTTHSRVTPGDGSDRGLKRVKTGRS